jgi:SAM-dependent methyltransferase
MWWMRRESLSILLNVFSPSDRLLEVGCGTGEEAWALSEKGLRIVATDISAGMLSEARSKQRPGAIHKPEFVHLAAGEVGQLIGRFGRSHFDGGYSSFGALNCEPSLGSVAAGLAELIRPHGRFVCSIMNRFCLWETAWYLLKCRPRAALRRWPSSWVSVEMSTSAGMRPVPIRYYSPTSFARLFEPCFRVEKTIGLPLLLPPPFLSNLCAKAPALFRVAEHLDRRLRGCSPMSGWGDHFLQVMQRKDGMRLPSDARSRGTS